MRKCDNDIFAVKMMRRYRSIYLKVHRLDDDEGGDKDKMDEGNDDDDEGGDKDEMDEDNDDDDDDGDNDDDDIIIIIQI